MITENNMRSKALYYTTSAVLFVVAVAFMAWLRLIVYPHTIITLTYALPMLLCLFHRDKVLLWSMAVAFACISTFKTFFLLQPRGVLEVEQWVMQIVNIAFTGIIVHYVIQISAKLTRRNEELAAANDELAARETEISRQNEELQRQGEELSEQNEELERQSEELRSQSEEVHILNQELSEKQTIVEAVLTSVRDASNETEIVNDLCTALSKMLGPDIQSTALVERSGTETTLHTWCGGSRPPTAVWPYQGSLAQIITEQGRTGFVDLAERPDLHPHPRSEIRSVLASPVQSKRGVIGVIEAFSVENRKWTKDHFRMIEWVAAQCAMALDIMRLRAELQRFNAELEQTVEKRTSELREMVEELEHFSYTITHDMRAPLRAIQGFAGMLDDSNGNALNPESKAWLKHIMRSVQRMDRLIIDALSYSKAVRQELTLTPVDPAELLIGIIHSYPVLQPPHSRIEIDPHLPKVLANEAGLTQCFSNLLTNAVKFVATGKKPHVRIRSDKEGGVVRLWFEDNGIGISPAAQRQLFKMFQRGSKDYEGTGIGLALVRKVALRMNGRVGVQSTPGEGSRFWIELQAADGAQPSQPGTWGESHRANAKLSM